MGDAFQIPGFALRHPVCLILFPSSVSAPNLLLFFLFFHLLCLTLSPFSPITSPGKGTMNCNNLFEFLFCLNVTHHVQSVTFPKFISRIRSKITLFTERRIEEQRQKQLLRLKKAKMVRHSHQSTIEEDSLTVWQSCKVLELQRHWTIVQNSGFKKWFDTYLKQVLLAYVKPS